MYNFGAETHLVAGVMSAFVFTSAAIARALASTSLAAQLSGKAHEDCDYTDMVGIVHRRLRAETDLGGKVVSTVIIFCLLSGCHCSLDSNSMVVT